jgi:hypothetical protein
MGQISDRLRNVFDFLPTPYCDTVSSGEGVKGGVKKTKRLVETGKCYKQIERRGKDPMPERQQY